MGQCEWRVGLVSCCLITRNASLYLAGWGGGRPGGVLLSSRGNNGRENGGRQEPGQKRETFLINKEFVGMYLKENMHGLTVPLHINGVNMVTKQL